MSSFLLVGLCTVIDLFSLQVDDYFCKWSSSLFHVVGLQQTQAAVIVLV